MMVIEIVGSILAGFLGLGVYLYYHRKGQFEDPEDVRYHVFRNDEDRES